MKLVTHSRRGKINEKEGGDGMKLVAQGFMLIKTHLICSALALRCLIV